MSGINGAATLKENNPEIIGQKFETKEDAKTSIAVGDQMKCPECKNIGRIVWISQDKQTVGVKCHGSHQEKVRTQSKYGARVTPSTKSRKNIVFLTAIG